MSFLWKPSRRVVAASFRLLTPISPHKPHIARQRLLGLGLALLGVFFFAPAVHAGLLDTSWTAPTTNADGSALTDLDHYNLYYGTSNPVTCPGGTFVTVPSPTSSPAPGTTVNYQLKGLQAGTTYFVKVTAVDTSGNESACSAQASAPARIEFSVTPSTTVNFGTVNIGSISDQTFSVQNIVGGTVSGTATASAPFSILSGSSFNLVGLNATQTVTVRFTPTTAGTALGNVNFTADGDTISRAVTGTGNQTNNPVPVLSTLSPTSATAGGAGFTLTVTGSNFVTASVINWNGASRTTSFVSSTQLTATISAADIATAGAASVTVFSPAPGGGTSGSLTFSINNAAPTLSTLSPSSATSGGSAFTLTVTGSNFYSSSGVRWNGAARTTTFVSSTQLTAAVSAADIATAGTASVTVFTPAPGGGTSGSLTFTINAPNPVPTLTTLSPNSATAGGAGFTLTATGSNFVASSVVRWNGTNRTTTFVSTTQLTAAISAADIATAGTAQVTVVTPAPGGGTSGALSFSINNAAPTLSTLSPNSAIAGGSAFTLTVTGTNFYSSSSVRWNGAARTTTFVNNTRLTAAIPAADIATAGSASVTVFTPAPGGGTSTALTFTIAGPLTVTNLTANLAAPQPPGTSITFTATATGGTAPYQFKWWYWDGSFWRVLRDWAPGNTYTWTPTVANSQYQITVWARSAGQTADTAEAYRGPLPFAITSAPNPAPTLGSLTPSSASAGGAAFTLTVTGTNFVSASVVQWNGASRTTTFVSSTQLTAAISAADISTAGSASVTVFTPAPGGGTSAPLSFTITGGSALTVTNLTANLTAPQPVGASITFTATASGGTTPYQFKWWLWDGSAWRAVRDWGVANTFTWTPTVANSQYQVTVWARNAGQTADTAQAYWGPLPFVISP